MKLRQKISGTFRSIDSLVDFRRIRGYISTARKNGLNALDALRRVFQGNPLVPAVNAEYRSGSRKRQTGSRSPRRKHPAPGCLPVHLRSS